MNSAGLAGTVLMILGFVVFAATVYAFIHAAMQRSDAYTATGKLTKPVWLIILGVSALLSFPYLGLLSIMGPIIAACAAGIYVVDVRPKLLEIQGKSR